MKSKYYELTIVINSNFIDFIADFVANIAVDGVEIGRDKIIVRSEDSLEYVENAIKSLNDTVGDSVIKSCKISLRDNEDWISKYKNSVKPIEVGKFYIYPSWYDKKESKINIKLDPALAFGSGHHATTSSCLKAIERFVKKGDRVLDVGCGSGILGLACRKLGAEVDLCDTDPMAVKSCKDNFELNGESYKRLWEGSANVATVEYDVVVANIIADVLKFIDYDLKRVLKDGGVLILSGILDKKEKSVADVYSDLELLLRVEKDEWVTLVYRKKTGKRQ